MFKVPATKASQGENVDEIVDFCGYPYELVKKIEEGFLVDA